MYAVVQAAALLGCALPHFIVASQINGDVRLVGSIDYYYEDERRVIGRIVAYYEGQWGSVCGYSSGVEYFGYYDTEVACQQLGGLQYAYYDYDGAEYYWPEDTGLYFLQHIYCDGLEEHLSECPWIDWVAHPDDCDDDVRSIVCSVPPAEDVVDPEFVFDMGFSDSGDKCLRADGVVRFGELYSEDGRRRRYGVPLTLAPTPSPLTPTPLPTPQPTHEDFEPNFNTSAWEVASCQSVYSGAGDGEVEILHKGQFSNNEICVRRADRQPWQDLYLRLLCRKVNLSSDMVSYTSKGCGPRGGDAVANTSHCILEAIVVATVQSEPPFPAAVVDGCSFFSFTEYFCLEDITETETATNTTFTSTTTATGCADYAPPEEEKWHDADGEDFDCAWYAGGPGAPDCSPLGDSARNFNHTANEACCVCGGGVAGPRTTTTRTATTASTTQTATTASAAPGARLHEVTGSLRFSSTGSPQQVQAAAAEALAELLGVPASKVAAEASPATSGLGGRRLTSTVGWWQVSYTVWSTALAADTQWRSVAELASNQAAAAALFAPRFEEAGLQLETSTLEMTQVDVAGATFTDTTTTITSATTTATTTAAQAGGRGGDSSATADDDDQLHVVFGVVVVVLAGIALMLACVAVIGHRWALIAKLATNEAAPMNASAETAGTCSHTSEVLAV